MAKCDFSIGFTGSPDILIGKANNAISNAGGQFNGNPQGGNFSISTPLGRVAGDYQITGQTISFSITEKPFLVGCGRIEDELKKYIT